MRKCFAWFRFGNICDSSAHFSPLTTGHTGFAFDGTTFPLCRRNSESRTTNALPLDTSEAQSHKDQMKSLLPKPVGLSRTIFVVLLLAVLGCRVASDSLPPRVDVLLWFDTEDYLLPADDDACLRLATLLSDRGIRSTFKVVGEKARMLERRGRTDVITALRRHAIGYHANFHSVHPTPTEYLADSGLMDGVSEFIRREGGGAADVRRIFGVPTLACYGQPGSSWAAQGVVALGPIGVAPDGVPCYVDEGSNVGWEQRPFWYAGALHVYHMGANHTRMELHDPSEVETGMKEVSAVVDRLSREDHGGLISIYYHPCEWVHQEFWDAVNFRRGRNPPREEWKAPGQLPPAETEAAFQRFAAYIDHIRGIPGVRFVTASDLPNLYPDLARRNGLSEAELKQLGQRIVDQAPTGLGAQTVGEKVLSPADQFECLTLAVKQMVDTGMARYPVRPGGLLGPDSPPPAIHHPTEISALAFRDTLRDVENFIRTQNRVPSRVYIGPDSIPPADFLVTVASAFLAMTTQGSFSTNAPFSIPVGITNSLERFIAPDSPSLFGGWIIHREGFRAPRVVEIARLQAWTLKPARRAIEP